MLHADRRHPEPVSRAVVSFPSRNAGVAIVSAMVLGLTACSSGQDGPLEPGQEEDVTVTETGVSPTEAEGSSPAQGTSQEETDQHAGSGEAETGNGAASASPTDSTRQDDHGDDAADAATPKSFEIYTEDPELRLITCDGYNQTTGEYEDNYVVYAPLIS